MKHFLQILLLSLRYKWSILASVVVAFCIAFLWGASISTVYPLVEVVFEGKTIQSWMEDAITDAENRSDRLRIEIVDLQGKRANLPRNPVTWPLKWARRSMITPFFSGR